MLGDGAAALAGSSGLPVAPGGPQDAPRIDAHVPIEAAILNGHDGLREMRWQVGRGDLPAFEDAASRESVAVLRLDDEGTRGRVHLQAAIEGQGRHAIADDQDQQDGEAAGDHKHVTQSDA